MVCIGCMYVSISLNENSPPITYNIARVDTTAALVLGHPIHLVGTANFGQPVKGFTQSPGYKIPLTLGYHQGQHYISLASTSNHTIPEITSTGISQEDITTSTQIPPEKKKTKKKICSVCGRSPL